MGQSLVSSTIWEILQQCRGKSSPWNSQIKKPTEKLHTNAANLAPQTPCLPIRTTHSDTLTSFKILSKLIHDFACQVWKAIVNSQSFTGATGSQLEWTYYQTTLALRWLICVNSAIWNVQHTNCPPPSSTLSPFHLSLFLSLSSVLSHSHSLLLLQHLPLMSFLRLLLLVSLRRGRSGCDCRCRHYACKRRITICNSSSWLSISPC